MADFIIYTDGGARGNPGHAGVGIVIQDGNKETIKEINKYLGETTNNQAEYRAVIFALEWILKNKKQSFVEVTHFLDSQLIEQQLKGNYKVKNEGLKPLFIMVIELVKKIGTVKFVHVPREKNKRADELVNQAIDAKLKK